MNQDHFDIAYEGCRILEETRITGNIKSVQDICVEGHVEGNVSSEKRVIVNKSGVISGDVNCDELYVNGQVTGNVYVTHKVWMGASAEIKGELITASLEITPGAKIGRGLKLKSASN